MIHPLTGKNYSDTVRGHEQARDDYNTILEWLRLDFAGVTVDHDLLGFVLTNLLICLDKAKSCLCLKHNNTEEEVEFCGLLTPLVGAASFSLTTAYTEQTWVRNLLHPFSATTQRRLGVPVDLQSAPSLQADLATYAKNIVRLRETIYAGNSLIEDRLFLLGLRDTEKAEIEGLLRINELLLQSRSWPILNRVANPETAALNPAVTPP
jgi:hypothetical protein